MKKTLLTVCAGVMMLSSCSTVKKITKSTNSRDVQIDVNQSGLVLRPLMADLSVENVRKEVVFTAPINISMDDMKQNALDLFISTHQCDQVVDPVFTITKTENGNKLKEVTIKVTGLPAKYTKIYQVDSLPKSIGQYAQLTKPFVRLDYINSIDESDPTTGVEINMGTYRGLQVDFAVGTGNLRSYASLESYKTGPTGFKADFYNDTNSTAQQYTYNGSIDRFSGSIGFMREFPAMRILKFRAIGGLSYSRFSLGTPAISATNGVTFNSVNNIGLRLGVGMDIKIYKNLSFIAKAHTNLGLFNIISKDSPSFNPDAELSIKKMKFDGIRPFDIGVGLRVIF